MCGIFAVSNIDDAVDKVFRGLKDLEYRGYDSWGIAAGSDGNIVAEKHLGKIAANPKLSESKYAFGHTRWATHGGVTISNTHPHLDCSGRFAVIHNGIVENGDIFKQKLIASGHKFTSQTDTEVLAHLIEAAFDGDLPAAVAKVFVQIEGYSAFVVFDGVTQEFAAVRRGSPLVVGIMNKGVLLASDALSLSSHTHRVVYLPEGIIAHVQAGKVRYSDLSGGKVTPKVERLSAGLKPTVRGSYPHFMLKEINEQPRVISAFKTQLTLPKARNVVLFGCGSAYYAAQFGANLLSKSAVSTQAVQANESDWVVRGMDERDLGVLVSQSGETLDVMETLRELKKRRVPTLALVNVIGSSLSREADLVIPLAAGPEVAVASTKVFTAMLSAFHMLSGGNTDQLVETGDAVSKLSTQYVSENILPVVAKLLSEQHVYILGKGSLYPIAMEAALKLKEVAYIHAEGFASGELKHGMIALIEQGTPVLVLVPDDATRSDLLSAAQEVKARGAYVIGVGVGSDPVFDRFLPVENVGQLTAIPMAVVAQLLAYHLAVAKGLDPDRPRNLAKSVTVK